MSKDFEKLIAFAVGAAAGALPAMVYFWWNQHRQTQLTSTVLQLIQEVSWWRAQGPDASDFGAGPQPAAEGDDSNRG